MQFSDFYKTLDPSFFILPTWEEKKPVRNSKTMEELRKDNYGEGSMLTSQQLKTLMSELPSCLDYSIIFSSRSLVRIVPEEIIVTYPVKDGCVTSQSREIRFKHATFCNLVESGWKVADINRNTYATNYSKKYTSINSQQLYTEMVEQLGYGAYLKDLLYGYTHGIITIIDMESVVKISDNLDLIQHFIATNCKPYIMEAKDGVDLCQFVDVNAEISVQPLFLEEDRSLLMKETHVITCQDINAVAVMLDHPGIDRETEISHIVVHVTIETEREVQVSFCPGLYDRAAAVITRDSFFHYSEHLKRFKTETKRHMVSKVIDVRALRRMLVGEAVRHRKIKKYNPRLYAYLTVYIRGEGKVHMSVYMKGQYSLEVLKSRIYKGPTYSKAKPSWGLFSTREVQEASLMTEHRLRFVHSDPELFHSTQVYEHFPPVLLTTLRGLMPSFTKLISAEICECSVHKCLCGVRFEHRLNPEITIPVICYNAQPDLNSYLIMWLNLYYKKKDGSWWREYDPDLKLECARLEEACQRLGVNVPRDILSRAFMFKWK
jgi:hypothetical protein